MGVSVASEVTPTVGLVTAIIDSQLNVRSTGTIPESGLQSIQSTFIPLGGDNAWLVGRVLCLFQTTVAVTLVAIAMLLPKHPAFSFGLNGLTFILGALPTFCAPVWEWRSAASFALVIATVFAGLWTVRDDITMRFRT